MSLTRRTILISIDDSEGCTRAVQWALANIYKQGDEIHLIHVIPRLQPPASHGMPPIDFLPYNDPAAYEQLVQDAETFINRRALQYMEDVAPHAVVHIIKYEIDNDSIGNVIVKKADELDAAVVVMSRHTKSKLQEFFLGSVTNFCLHHCKKPVVIVG